MKENFLKEIKSPNINDINYSNKILLNKAKNGDIFQLENYLIEENVNDKGNNLLFFRNILYIDHFGTTALHLSCLNGHIEFVKKLLNISSIDINCQDLFGRTPVNIF